jgi:hypothetical protein
VNAQDMQSRAPRNRAKNIGRFEAAVPGLCPESTCTLGAKVLNSPKTKAARQRAINTPTGLTRRHGMSVLASYRKNSPLAPMRR